MIYQKITAPLIKLITPFKTLTPLERMLSNIALLLAIVLFWSYSGSKYIPAPLDVLRAFPTLFDERDLVRNYFQSLGFCFKAIFFASIISLALSYVAVLPLFSTFCSFLRKFRFLPSAGLATLFVKITPDMEHAMSAMMVFGVATWLIDSVVGVALSIKPDEIMYAKSLRLTRFQMWRELLVRGKAAQMFNAIIGNFAMAWMLLAAVENMVKANGGIGVVLADSYKYYRYDQVYAVQLIIIISGNALDFLLNWISGLLFPYTKLDEPK